MSLPLPSNDSKPGVCEEGKAPIYQNSDGAVQKAADISMNRSAEWKCRIHN